MRFLDLRIRLHNLFGFGQSRTLKTDLLVALLNGYRDSFTRTMIAIWMIPGGDPGLVGFHFETSCGQTAVISRWHRNGPGELELVALGLQHLIGKMDGKHGFAAGSDGGNI